MNVIKIVSITIIVVSGIIIWVLYSFLSSLKPTLEKKLPPHKFDAIRSLSQPIVTTQMHPMLIAEADEIGYTNVNGPSVIRVPDWIEDPLGQYYLYFAHHKGTFLRLAYADTLTGPWTISDHHILPLSTSGFATEAKDTDTFKTLRKHNSWSEIIALYDVGSKYQQAYKQRTKKEVITTTPTTPHVASPDVIVDEINKQIRLYYHGVVEGRLQKSKVALSSDGINFNPLPDIITLPYVRMFRYRNAYYGLAMPGHLYRSKDGLSDFEVRQRWLFSTDHRHHTLYLRGNELYVFYTVVGDAPESIKYCSIDLSPTDWNDWKAKQGIDLLSPQLDWEGANEENLPSMRGEVGFKVNQLRDPAFFEDLDGQQYLFYAGGGEQAIGLAKLTISNR